MEIEALIRDLGLKAHPEGGYFKETYRCDETAGPELLPERFEGNRAYSTAIYYLLAGSDISAFHRIKSDEIWHFYSGRTIIIHVIHSDGTLEQKKLGSNPDRGESFQVLVKRGCWFAAGLEYEEGYALVGCTVSPGFDFADFEMGNRQRLVLSYPEHQALIEKYTT